VLERRPLQCEIDAINLPLDDSATTPHRYNIIEVPIDNMTLGSVEKA